MTSVLTISRQSQCSRILFWLTVDDFTCQGETSCQKRFMLSCESSSLLLSQTSHYLEKASLSLGFEPYLRVIYRGVS